MEQEKKIKAGQKTIYLRDEEDVKKINDIMTHPEYAMSFNKVMTKALNYGLDILHKEMFPDVTKDMKDKIIKFKNQVVDEDTFAEQIDKYMSININLIKEQLVEIASIKYMVASLFNLKSEALGMNYISKENFEKGHLKNTPQFLHFFENQAYKNIRGED